MALLTRTSSSTMPPIDSYVLLVDDDFESVEPLGELVRFAGHRTATARSAIEAFACCFHRRPSVVVTDLDMPGKDGRDLARWFKRKHPLIPLVLVTGHDLDHPDWIVHREHFEAIFPKPLDFDQFLVTLTRLMSPPRRRASSPSRP